jgi:hypothetical protein
MLGALALAAVLAPAPEGAAHVLICEGQSVEWCEGVAAQLSARGVRVSAMEDVEAGLLLAGPILAQRAPVVVPPELRGEWERGVAACRAQAGRPPYNMQNAGAALCGRSLGAYMAQRLLEVRGVESVVELHVTKRSDGVTTLAAIQRYETASNQKRSLAVKPGDVTTPESAAESVVAWLRADGARMEPRFVVRKPPEPPHGEAELFSGEAPPLDPLPVPPNCRAPLPARLSVEPTSAGLARAISDLWLASVSRSNPVGPAAECKLGVFRAYGAVLTPRTGDEEPWAWGATVDCGATAAYASAMGQDLKAPATLRVLAKMTVERLLAGHCRTDPTSVSEQKGRETGIPVLPMNCRTLPRAITVKPGSPAATALAEVWSRVVDAAPATVAPWTCELEAKETGTYFQTDLYNFHAVLRCPSLEVEANVGSIQDDYVGLRIARALAAKVVTHVCILQAAKQ